MAAAARNLVQLSLKLFKSDSRGGGGDLYFSWEKFLNSFLGNDSLSVNLKGKPATCKTSELASEIHKKFVWIWELLGKSFY